MKLKPLMRLGLLLVALSMTGCNALAPPAPVVLPPTATPRPTSTSRPTATLAVPSPTPSGKVPIGFTADGAPYRGNPNAPVTLLEYGEFL